MSQLPLLLKVFSHEFSTASKLTKGPHMLSVYVMLKVLLPTDLQLALAQLLQSLNVQYPGQLQSASSGLSPDQLTLLNSALETGTSTC